MNQLTSTQRSPKEVMLLALSFGTAVGITPFTVYRFTIGDFWVGVLDLIVVIFMTALGVFIYKTRRVDIAAIILIIVAIGGNIFSFYLKGISQIYWVYPAMLSAYYILSAKFAATLNGVLLLLYFPGLFSDMNNVGLSTIIVTLIVTNLIAYVFSSNLNKQQQKLILLASRDYLTQTGNRRKLDSDINELHAELVAGETTASLILLDLDHFKEINDNHGHVLGDRVLFNLSQILKNHVSDEVIYRYGGEEFLIICKNCNQEEAYTLAEKIRKEIETSEIMAQQQITISLGVSEFHQGGVQQWIQRVDEALYKAKNQGRNQTVVN